MTELPLTVFVEFPKSDAQRLLALARFEREGGRHKHARMLASGAEAAVKGEPMTLICSDKDEAEEFAATFTMLGAARPTLIYPY